MSGGARNRDVDVVVHVLLAVALVAADAFVLLFLIPDLFDAHSSALDLLSLLLLIGSLAFSYLAGRYLWRSAHGIDGEDQ